MLFRSIMQSTYYKVKTTRKYQLERIASREKRSQGPNPGFLDFVKYIFKIEIHALQLVNWRKTDSFVEHVGYYAIFGFPSMVERKMDCCFGMVWLSHPNGRNTIAPSFAGFFGGIDSAHECKVLRMEILLLVRSNLQK